MEAKAIQQLVLAITIEIISPISLWNTYMDQDILFMSLNKPLFLAEKVRFASDYSKQLLMKSDLILFETISIRIFMLYFMF